MADLSARVRDFDTDAFYQIGTQVVQLNLDYGQGKDTWSLGSRGEKGEVVSLEGRLLLPDSADGWADFWKSASLTLKGRLENIPLRLGPEIMELDSRIIHARLGWNDVLFRLETGGKSTLQADLHRKGKYWTGHFQAEIEKGERLLKTIPDTSVTCSKVVLEGRVLPTGVSADSRSYDVRAYGFIADSIHASHFLGRESYLLRTSRLFQDGIRWQVQGGVQFAEAFNPLSFKAHNPRFGSLAYSMPSKGVIAARAEKLHLMALPYPALDTLQVRDPVVTGDFRWNRLADRGRLDADVSGDYAGRRVRNRGRARWTPDSLFFPILAERHVGSFLWAEARFHLGPHHCYELNKLKSGDLGSDSLLILAETSSEEIRLLDDSIRIVVAGLLGESRRVHVRIVAAESLTAEFQGILQGLETLSSRLNVHGEIPLPGQAGRLWGLDIRARIRLPLDSLFLQGLAIEADTFRGIYAVPRLDTQWFSGSMIARERTLTLPEPEIRNRKGQELLGTAVYNYLGETALRAQLGGGDLALRLPDGRELDLDQVRAVLRMDDSVLPFLGVSATLSESRVEYRLRSIEDIEELFAGEESDPPQERARHMELRLDLRAIGDSNVIESDIVRLTLVGSVEVTGTTSRPLVTGAVRALEGELGFQGQSYDLRKFEVEWPGALLEEGRVELRAEKELASTCEPQKEDSCTVATFLQGTLSDLAFT